MDAFVLYCFVVPDSLTLENPLEHCCSCKYDSGRICYLQGKVPSLFPGTLAYLLHVIYLGNLTAMITSFFLVASWKF